MEDSRSDSIGPEGLRSSIPSENPVPVIDRGGYEFAAATLGRLERLARADFDFRLYKRGSDFDQNAKLLSIDEPNLSRHFTEDQLRTIAQSVFASSEIEGEHYLASSLDIHVAALTEPTKEVGSELGQRQASFADQVETYLWLLESSPEAPLTVELVLSVHERMFRNHPRIGSQAGKLKKEPVDIKYKDSSGTERIIHMIPPELTENYLESACDLFNRNCLLSKSQSEYSILVAAAEFHCDYLAIHPFSDGNGRTARLLSAYLLHRAGYRFTYLYPFDQVILDRRRDYYRALYVAQKNWHTKDEDLTPWVKFYISAVFEQFERALRRVRDANEAP
jgi:Fic family protein